MEQQAQSEKRSHDDTTCTTPTKMRTQKDGGRPEAQPQTVHVNNLPPKYSQTDLLMFASQFGEVIAKSFFFSYATIVFANRQSAFKMKRTTKTFGNCRLGLELRPTPGSPHEQKKKKKNKGRYQAHSAPPMDHARVTAGLGEEMDFCQELEVLCNELLPPDQTLSFTRVIYHLHTVVGRMLRGSYEILSFGSTVTSLAFKGSDIDLLLDWKATMHRYHSDPTDDRPVQEVSVDDMWLMDDVYRAVLRNPQWFQHVVFVKFAKVPIVKFKHVPTQVNCDLSFKNVSGYQNSLLIKFYLTLDERVKPLLFIIKYWAKFFDVVRLGRFTNYALTMMALFYLQQLDEPIIPPVCVLQETCRKKLYVDSWECSFNKDWKPVEPTKNVLSLPELLQGFFEFYLTFDFQTAIVCPLLGRSLPKHLFQNPKQLPPEMGQLRNYTSSEELHLECHSFVQDPFIRNFNVTRAVQQNALHTFQNACMTSLYVLSESKVSATSKGLLKHLLRQRTTDLSKVTFLLKERHEKKQEDGDNAFLRALDRISAHSLLSNKPKTSKQNLSNSVSTTDTHKKPAPNTKISPTTTDNLV